MSACGNELSLLERPEEACQLVDLMQVNVINHTVGYQQQQRIEDDFMSVDVVWPAAKD